MDLSQLSPQARIDRVEAQRSLYYLCKEILGYKDMVPHVHGDVCTFQTHPRYGRFRQTTIPRSWFKTVVCTIGKSIWLSLPDEEGLYSDIYPYKGPNVRILIVSNVIDNAAKMVNMIKRQWESNERLKAAFPEIVPEFNKTRWSDHCAELKRSTKLLGATEGTYTAVGVGGSVISQHFDHIIEDDLIYAKKDDFSGMELMPTQEDIDNAIGWHKLALSLLVDPSKSCIDNTGTRWAPHDIIAYIRKYETQYSTFEIAVTRDAIWPFLTADDCIWPERYDVDTLIQVRQSQGPKIFECFPQEAPILMSDWSTKPVSEVKLDDEVIGIMKGFGQYKSCLTKATINLVEKMEKAVVKVTLDSGKVIRCTADHPWYTGRTSRDHSAYLPARVGGSLCRVHDLKEPTTEQLLDYRYLAGLIDGEGACKHGSIAIGQSKWANPEVYEGILDVVERLQVPYKISTVNPNETHVLRNKVIARGLAQSIVLGGGRQVKGDIIRFGRPAKSGQILKNMWKRCAHPIRGRNKVVSIEPDGVETVYAIGTTTGNYVAYGYATKNTQYLNRPRAGEDVTFDVSYLHRHNSLEEFPSGLEFRTYVDLASWGDKKRIAKNVVLTGAKDSRNHLWISRIDSGRLNPSQVISKFKEHWRQFNSRVLIEEIQYQRAIRHFAKLDMEATGDFYYIDQLPYDGRKDAKNLRITALEPLVRNGAVHCLNSMSDLIGEMEDYPYSQTVDVLDCLGYLLRHCPVSGADSFKSLSREVNTRDSIEEELHKRSKGQNGYPFDMQLAHDKSGRYTHVAF